MRKTWWVVVVVALGVAGYFGVQAYSSQVFERELTRTLDTLRDDSQWQVEREAVERGWFHSQGQVLVSPANGDWLARVPYDARHGLLSTRLSGALQIRLAGSDSAQAGRLLFGDILPSAEPRWTATFHTLERRGEGRLDVAGFELAREGATFSFTGAEFTIEGRAGDISVQGQVAPLHWRRGREEIVTGPVHVDSRYQFSEPGFFHQRSELMVERLDYQGPQRASVTLTGLRYRDEIRLDEQLRLDMSLSLEQAQVAGQALLSGRLDASLGRIDGDAVRRLMGEIEEAVEESGGDLSPLDETQRQALLRRLEPAILSTLVDSPRFVLEGMSLASPLLGVDMRGHGELVFDGENAETLSVTGLVRSDFEAWRERLNGRFSWYGVPPLVALQLGLPLETRKVEVTIEAGEVRINGRPLPPLI